MKKLIYIILSTMIWQISFAGEFSFFKGDQNLYIFSKDSASYDNIIPLAYQFDQVNPIDGGLVLKSYNYQSYYGVEDILACNPYSSWVGDSVILYTDGSTRIINQYGHSLYFQSMISTESWVIFQEENGARMEGRFAGFETFETFPGFNDLIGTIEITVYDSLGNIFSNHPYQGFKIIISQSFGVIKTFSLNSFIGIYEEGDWSIDKSVYYLVGVKTPETQYGFLYRFNPIVSRVDVGTEIHYSYSYLTKEDEGYYEVKRKFLNKSFNDSLVIYEGQECIHYWTYDFDTLYTTVFKESYHYNLRPREIKFAENPSEQSYIRVHRMTRDGDFETRESFKFSIFELDYSFSHNDKTLWAVKPDYSYSMGAYLVYEFIDGLGRFKRYRGESKTGDHIVYYKTPTEEWGIPLEFNCPDNIGLKETQKTQITIYPNPTEDIIYINSPQKIDQAIIYDMQGRLLKQFELRNQSLLDVSDLESGVYLLVIMNEKKQISQHKILHR